MAFAVALLIVATIAAILLVAMQYNIIQYRVLQASSATSRAEFRVTCMGLCALINHHTALLAPKVNRFLNKVCHNESDSL